MGTKFPTRDVAPPVLLRHVLAPRRIQGIEDPAAGLGRLTTHKQHDFFFGVVDEAVRDSCTSWECGQITLLHAIGVTVDPGVYLACYDVHELFFILFGMGPRRTSARWKALYVDAYAIKSSLFAEATHWPHWLTALRVRMRVLRHFACRPDAGRAFRHVCSLLCAARRTALCRLTFELTGSQRQDARPDERMICPATRRAWWPAVGAPVERGVRRHFVREGALGSNSSG